MITESCAGEPDSKNKARSILKDIPKDILYLAPEEKAVALKKVSANGYDLESPASRQDALLWAAGDHKGDLNVFKCLLLQNSIDIDFKDNNSRSALYVAADNGNQAMVELLLKFKADINTRDKYGITPACAAYRSEHEEVLELLLEHGADPDARDNHDRTALMGPKWRNQISARMILLYQEYDADIDAKDRWNETALIHAARRGYCEIVEALIQCGASINFKGLGDMTPLMYAAENGFASTVESLLKNGADIDAKERKGKNAMMVATENNQQAVMELLQKAHDKQVAKS
jgi:ankyrin repeat protein